MKWFCILASLIWGMNIIFMKVLLVNQPPLVLAFWRVLLCAIVIFIFGKTKRLSFRINKMERHQLFLLGLLNVTLNFSLSFYAIKLVDGKNVAMLNALNPVIICFLLWIFYHQKPSLRTSLGIFFTLLGVGYSFQFDWQTLTLGHILLVLSSACYAGSFLFGQTLKMNNMVKSFYTMLFGALMLGLFLFFKGELTFIKMLSYQWVLFILISVIGFGYIQLVYFVSSEKIGMKKTSAYMNLNPLFSYLGALFFLREALIVNEVIAMILILLGLGIANNEKESKKLS